MPLQKKMMREKNNPKDMLSPTNSRGKPSSNKEKKLKKVEYQNKSAHSVMKILIIAQFKE